MPIKNLSEQRRMPRLGKIHLGIKVEKKNDKGEVVSTYPKAVDFFVCPPEVQEIFGEQPKSLDIMFPVEDAEKFASQFYKCYSSFRGLVCRGNGETCMRMVDASTGDFAHRDTKIVAMAEAPCEGQECQNYKAKKCKEIMCLQFLLPAVPGLGVWQLDTGSYHSIVTINSAIDLIKGMCGRVSMIPLKLTLEPKEVVVEGKKKNVHILNIRADVTLAEIQKFASLPIGKVLIPIPDENKPELLYPEDEAPMGEPEEPVKETTKPVKKPSHKPVDPEQAKKDIDDLWPEDEQASKPVSEPTKSKSSPVKQATNTISPEESKKPTREELMAMEFKDAGQFKSAALKYFNLQPSQIDKETSIYDLSKSNQRKQAWEQIVGTFYESVYQRPEGK